MSWQSLATALRSPTVPAATSPRPWHWLLTTRVLAISSESRTPICALAQVVTLTVNSTNGRLLFANDQGNKSQYDLTILRANSNDLKMFAHSNLVVEPTDAHYFDYGAWDCSGSLDLLIDHASNGTIDETVTLENQIWSVYLPIVVR